MILTATVSKALFINNVGLQFPFVVIYFCESAEIS